MSNATTTTSTTTNVPPNAPRPSSSLYVGDLAPDVTEQILYDHFKRVGAIPSIRVLRDSTTGASLGYAYVNFASQAEAEKALNELNYSRIRDRPCRIMYVNRDPSLRKSGVGNIIIRNLAKEIDYRGVSELCTKYGPILSCRIMYDSMTGVSKGCAFVHFANESSAADAVIHLNGKIVRAENSPEDAEIQPLKVEHYQPQQVLQQRALDTFTNVYVKHLKADVSDEQLKALFDSYGETLSVRIMRNGSESSKGFAFASFKEHPSAVKAIDALHDKEHEFAMEGKHMYVQRAMKRSERQKYVRQALRERRLQYAQYTNLYVKNLDDVVTSEKLFTVFSAYGEIRSAKVMKDPATGISKGFGFVSFINAEDAKRAVKELANRLILSSKPLFVTYAQTKDERRQQLEERQQRARYQQMDAGFPGLGVGGPGQQQHYAPPPQLPQPMYPFGTPGVFPNSGHVMAGGPRPPPQQQQQHPHMINPMMQPRPLAQQQQHPHASMMNMPQHRMPYPTPGHPMSHPQALRQGVMAGPPHAGQHPALPQMPHMPMMMKQPNNTNAISAVPRAAALPTPASVQLPNAAPGATAVVSQGPPGAALPASLSAAAVNGLAPVVGGLNPAAAAVAGANPTAAGATTTAGAPPRPLPKSTSGIDPSMLAQLQPEQARNFLGEKLYHRICKMYPDQAAKITGMLLEMDNSEILNLLDSTDLLELKVQEAVDVLRNHNK